MSGSLFNHSSPSQLAAFIALLVGIFLLFVTLGVVRRRIDSRNRQHAFWARRPDALLAALAATTPPVLREVWTRAPPTKEERACVKWADFQPLGAEVPPFPTLEDVTIPTPSLPAPVPYQEKELEVFTSAPETQVAVLVAMPSPIHHANTTITERPRDDGDPFAGQLFSIGIARAPRAPDKPDTD